jgi:uncharacterized membrane protein
MAGPSGPIAPGTFQKPPRLHFIDLLRGIVIILMALDHTRMYFAATLFDPLDIEASDPAYFFTRFVTHFCAPVFILLAGASAYLYRNARQASAAQLSRFLLTRGAWLVVVEVVLVSWLWYFGYEYLVFQVIWAIGISMIALAALVFLPTWAIAAVAAVLILGHNLFDGVDVGAEGVLGGLWRVLHVPETIMTPDLPIKGILYEYPVIPWVGVIALGYVLAPLLLEPPKLRDKRLVLLGAVFVVAFVVLRSLNHYGDPSPWTGAGHGFIMQVADFLNVTKYPASLQFLLITIGPVLMVMPLLARWQGPLARWIGVFGKVPFFFYIVHIAVIHAVSLVWQQASFGATTRDFYDTASWPAGYEPNLLRLYLVWAGVVLVLYWPCKWFAGVKRRRSDWWLSYL